MDVRGGFTALEINIDFVGFLIWKRLGINVEAKTLTFSKAFSLLLQDSIGTDNLHYKKKKSFVH